MKFENTAELMEKGTAVLNSFIQLFSGLETIELSRLEREETCLVMVDMLNGFAIQGPLSSERVKGLIPGIAALLGACKERNIERIAFSDHHKADSVEFGSYPPHCVRGTEESYMVKELMTIGGYTEFQKNSTNGFFAPEFQTWLNNHGKIKNWILVGDCTDICILQLATTLKAWMNQNEKEGRVIVPMELVDTFDGGDHSAEWMNLFSFYNMKGNGIEIIRTISFD